MEIKRGQYSEPSLTHGGRRERFLHDRLENERKNARGKLLLENKATIEGFLDGVVFPEVQVTPVPVDLPDELKELIAKYKDNLVRLTNTI